MARNQPKKQTLKKPKDESAKPDLKIAAGVGHNSGKVIPEVLTNINRILSIREQKKALGREETEIRNLLKEKFGVNKTALSDELSLRAKDPTVRIQIEAARHDLKIMTGYQMALDLKPDTVARTEEEFVDPNDPEAEANKLALKR